MAPAYVLTSALLILLLGKYWEYSKDRSGLHINSSQTFLPRSSSSGLEQKSSSMISELGTAEEGWLTAAGGAAALLLGAAASAASCTAAASALHLQLTTARLLLLLLLPAGNLRGCCWGRLIASGAPAAVELPLCSERCNCCCMCNIVRVCGLIAA